jgi:mannose-6-phosphate isomerase
MQLTTALFVAPAYRDYVWGGDRLRPGQRTGELWAVHEDNSVVNGSFAGRTLAEVALENPAGLIGERGFERFGSRFPLLVKLLDCAEWLSLQVHPDDAQAVKLQGAGSAGKTEAWYILDAEPGARLIAGTKPGTGTKELAAGIRNGKILDLVEYREVQKGDTVFMPARTLHALGPGLLVYEVQQSSDITYRVYDWDRPATAARSLHIDQSLAVADPAASAAVEHEPKLGDGESAALIQCPYFTLELTAAQGAPVQLNTDGMTFHALTVIEGEVEIVMPGAQPTPGDEAETVRLARYESAVIPAMSGPYELRPLASARILKASVEE